MLTPSSPPSGISNRDVFEAREKKAHFYSWRVFVAGEIIAEVPYLLVRLISFSLHLSLLSHVHALTVMLSFFHQFCAFIYWACWYAVVGFSFKASIVGPVFLQMTLYEFLYVSTSISSASITAIRGILLKCH